jgi:hypothetical protein
VKLLKPTRRAANFICRITRSTDRILSYAEGKQLSAEQLAALKAEQAGDESLAELLAEVEAAFSNAANRVRVLATAGPDTPRAGAASCCRPLSAAH